MVDFHLHGQGDAYVRVKDGSGNVVEADCPATPPKKNKGGILGRLLNYLEIEDDLLALYCLALEFA